MSLEKLLLLGIVLLPIIMFLTIFGSDVVSFFSEATSQSDVDSVTDSANGIDFRN